ncbi:hypothetical protein DSL92_00685 [Billgrantia gudaonensis]|uniref:Uncharacterized protein n=1 Tax=Billgrantia gudaonensis TaxID=376427 RepID=A0A3S0QGE8_9GAMM|nr:hypothetical protein DSL92_00685 [Halomonas gudaonensis]
MLHALLSGRPHLVSDFIERARCRFAMIGDSQHRHSTVGVELDDLAVEPVLQNVVTEASLITPVRRARRWPLRARPSRSPPAPGPSSHYAGEMYPHKAFVDQRLNAAIEGIADLFKATSRSSSSRISSNGGRSVR